MLFYLQQFILKDILNILTDWKHVISTDGIIPFNVAPEKLSTEMIELTNIDQSSYEEKITFFYIAIEYSSINV